MPDPIDYIDDAEDEETLVHLLDRVLDVGIVVSGNLRLSIANVDLIHVGLRLFVGSADKIDRLSRERAARIAGAEP